MRLKLIAGFVKLVTLPVVYLMFGPFIGAYRGLTGENTPLNYGRLVREYPREGYVATGWRDWLDGPDEDRPSVFGAMFSTWLGTMTASIPWLFFRGAVEGFIGLLKIWKLPYEGTRMLLYDFPVTSLRAIRRIVHSPAGDGSARNEHIEAVRRDN